MGLLARLLLGPPRRPDEVADLSVDLERWTVLGLDRGATQADVERWLGPPEDWFARRRGHLLYPALGVRVSVDGQGRLSGIDVKAGRYDGSAPGPDEPQLFAGVWRPWGRKTPPDEAELTALLGPPSLREVDDEEVALEWDLGAQFVGADLDHQGQLVILYVDLANDR